MNFQSLPKKKQPVLTNDSILESLRSIGSGVGKTVAKDVVGKVGSDTLASLFGALPKRGEITPDRPFAGRYEQQVRPQPRPEIPQQLIENEKVMVQRQLETIRAELKALVASMKNLHQEIQKAIEETPVDPGIYHVNFFERLRAVLKILREQIKDSRSWLALWNNRKQKKHFWGLYKKHGTKFGLSSERTLATSAG
ncbi:hypothetical protein KKB64_02455 [Patescibacteria group bacterium]|nr:hypothetical protein [Patescibacteria group bacterium]MBU2460142.1 hypothetical protein [Patescibacteria group bacterium]MBU2544433.1 hypothetical protein [Patescibacteria group bacterium]